MPFLPGLAEDATQKEIFSRWPEITEPVVILAQRLMCDGPLSRANAELIFTYVSWINKCQYAFNVHRHTAEALGIDGDLLEGVLEDINGAGIDDKIKVLLKYVHKLTESPAMMTQADADSVFKAGWSEQEFHYAVSICAFTNYMNRSLQGHGILGTPEHWEASGKNIAEHEYLKFLPE